MSLENITRNRSDKGNIAHGQAREGVTSGSTGLAWRPCTFPQDHDPPPSSIALSSRKKPRFDVIAHDNHSNYLCLDLEEESSQQEQSSPQLPDDFLEPLPPDESLAVDTPLMCLLPSSPVELADSGKSVGQVCKQFWKAGDYPGIRSDHKFVAGGMDHVRVHPKFLHSNATSHKWALGAVAELLDNAFDEVVNGATAVSIDMVRNPRNGEPMLLIEDDGGGMNPDSMRHCLSLGYSVKSKIANTIGQYGNGFKTSTMRLGADVIVFSRCSRKGHGNPTESIGLLSYTFLRDTGQDDIIVPIVDYELQTFGLRKLIRGSVGDWNKNMAIVTQWSPYSSEALLLDQFKGMSRQGTRVVVYNLWEDEQGELELDFMTSADDIQVSGVNRDEKNIKMAKQYPNCRHYLTYRHSLRSYASILYLRLPSQFKIFLRGKEVQHHSLREDLMLIEEVTYKPQRRSVHAQKDAGEMKAVVTIGFVKDAKEHIDIQGFCVYHKNRLVKPFWRIWNTPDSRGRGIIGVLEANFVEPAHDKQGFERTIVLARLETRLIEMQKSYWSRNCHEVGYVNKSLKKDGKLIAQSDRPATDDWGLENHNDALSRVQDLEGQGGAPSVALLTHSQVEFLSYTRPEWETQSIPASVEILAREDLEVQVSAGLLTHRQVDLLSPTGKEWETRSIPTSKETMAREARSESHCTGQMLQDLATVQSSIHMQDVPDASFGPQEASFKGGMHAAKQSFLLKTMAAPNSMPREMDSTSRPRRSQTTQTATTEALDLDPSSLVQERQDVTMKGDKHVLPITRSLRKFALSSAPDDLEQDDVVSGCSLRTGQIVDAVSQESSNLPSGNQVPRRIPASMTPCQSNPLEVDAVASLKPPLVSSKGFSASNTSILGSISDLSQNSVSEVGEILEQHPSSAEKAVDLPSAFPKISSSENASPMRRGSQIKHKPLEDICSVVPQKAAVTAVRKHLDIRESAVNSCADASQGSEMQISSSLNKSGLLSSCEHLTTAELKSQFSCMEQEVQFLQRSIVEVVREAGQLREQLQVERQLVEMEMEELRKRLGRALSHLENLKTENNIATQSCITKA